MTTEQKLERIENLIKESALADVSKDDFYNEIEEQRLIDIKDEMWELYCFAHDVVVTMKM